MKKFFNIKTISILFIIYLIISFTFFLQNKISPEEIEVILTLNDNPTLIPNVVIGLIFYLATFIFNNITLLAIYFAIVIALKHFKKDKLNPDDFKKDINYYRNILVGFSPSELSYIDDFQLDKEKDVAATLLSLKHKNMINFRDDKIILTTNNDTKYISNNEKYILSNIKDGKLKNINFMEFTQHVVEDSIANGLLTNKISEKLSDNFIKLVRRFFIIFILDFIFPMLSVILGTIGLSTIAIIFAFLEILLIGFSIFYGTFLTVYLFTYIIKSAISPLSRSKKGEEINKKLEGLKIFLKDFSLINNKDINSIEIWGDYLIYSVIFGQNEKIVEDININFIEG